MLLWITSQAQAIDLLESYHAARDHDSTLASARAAHGGGIEALPQAQAALGPTVQGTAFAGGLRARPAGYPETSGTTAQAGVSIVQPLYRSQDSIAVDEAKSQVSRLDIQLTAAETDLILRVSQAYFNALLAQDTLTYIRQQRTAIAQQLAQARRSFEVGTATVTDVSDAKSRFDLAVATEIQDRGNMEVARRALEQLTGVATNSLAPVPENRPLNPPQPDDLTYWMSAAENASPAVALARATLEIQSREIERGRASFRPTLDLVGNLSTQTYSQSYLNLASGGGRNAELGIQLTVPLWDAGLSNSRTRQAVAGAEQARQDLETSKRNAVSAARQSFIGVTSGIAQVQALEQAVTSSETSLTASLRGQQIGSRTAIDVLNARQQLFQARSQLATARYSVMLSQLQLKSTVGSLTEGDLQGLTDTEAATVLIPLDEPLPAIIKDTGRGDDPAAGVGLQLSGHITKPKSK